MPSSVTTFAGALVEYMTLTVGSARRNSIIDVHDLYHHTLLRIPDLLRATEVFARSVSYDPVVRQEGAILHALLEHVQARWDACKWHGTLRRMLSHENLYCTASDILAHSERLLFLIDITYQARSDPVAVRRQGDAPSRGGRVAFSDPLTGVRAGYVLPQRPATPRARGAPAPAAVAGAGVIPSHIDASVAYHHVYVGLIRRCRDQADRLLTSVR